MSFFPFLAKYYTYTALILLFLGNASCQKPIQGQSTSINQGSNSANNIDKGSDSKIDGMTMVAPPNEFSKNPMDDILAIHADWIAVVPYAYTRVGDPSVHFGESTGQWWGETPAGAKETIRLAHQAGLKVMLKPQVYVPGSWTGAIEYEDEDGWQSWEADYEKYIMTYAKMASEMKVELFCIGTEFKISSIQRPAYWLSLIDKIKKVYSGKLTYASNWDEYPYISWWNQVDYIGVDAYFPLSDQAEPSVSDLTEAWQPVAKELKAMSKKIKRPILFTEFGYMSVEGCAGKTWELEKNRSVLTYSEQAQANAFDALYGVFWPTNYWAGGFIWKWYPNEFANKRRMTKDYTPQNKLGQSTLSKWYIK